MSGRAARRNAFIVENQLENLKEETPSAEIAHDTPEKTNGLPQYIINAFKEVFDLFDSNGGGTIDAEELDLALRSVDIQLSQEEIVDVLTTMDKDGNGEIDFEEFLNLMTNTERFLEGLDHSKDTPEQSARRETMLFEALTNFMKRSALHSINAIVGFYHTKYKRIQAPHVVGHYIAGARLIGLTEGQLRKHMETLKQRHAEGGEKSPYAEPLHIVFGNAAKKKRPKKVKVTAQPACRGKIRLRFPSVNSSTPMVENKIVQAATPQNTLPDRLNVLRQRRLNQTKKALAKTIRASSWKAQRIKPFSVQLPEIARKGSTTPSSQLEDSTNVEHLSQIRNKVEKAKEHYYEHVYEQKRLESLDHWKALKSENIKSEALRNKFRIAFNAYTNYLYIDDPQTVYIPPKVQQVQKRSKSVAEKRHSVAIPSPLRKRAHSTLP